MQPFTVLVIVLIVGYVVTRVVISNKQYERKKSYLMIVKHDGQEFRSSCVALGRSEAENTLHQDITRQIRDAGLNPFDGSTEYRLFGETLTEVLPEKMLVFRPNKRQG